MTQVFLSTWGQNDNIGDSILRRGLLRSFQGMDGVELHVHVGRREPGEANDEGYLSALGLRGDEVLYDRAIDWLRGASTKVFAKRTIMVSLLVWIYFTEGVVRATSEGGIGALLAGIEVLLCLVLFAACAMHVRMRLRSVRETAA